MFGLFEEKVTSLSVSFNSPASGKAVMMSVASRLQLLIQSKKLILFVVVGNMCQDWFDLTARSVVLNTAHNSLGVITVQRQQTLVSGA